MEMLCYNSSGGTLIDQGPILIVERKLKISLMIFGKFNHSNTIKDSGMKIKD